ncbi:ABC transporter ATP-binding protein [Marisediminicola antarctica]|uniref:ABC transporter ATP-binding protein n=1 Tax=Marisediminicola antarctica TaxID=674079 RepID=UPI00137998AA
MTNSTPTDSANAETNTRPQKLIGSSSTSATIATTTSITTVKNTSGARIELSDVSKRYPNQAVPAVENFSMEAQPGELIMFVGPSGCGKTTTMKMINRIIEPTSGSIKIDGKDVLSFDPNDLRRHIGYVIQQIGLFPHMTIAENIGVVPRLLGWSKAKIAGRVDELLSVVQLDPGTFANRYPKQLSGGQQQRIGVARALAADPPVMLMDEPFGATDPITREKLQIEFLRLQETIGKTIIFVTHDFDEAVRLGDRIAVLSDRSQIEQFDTPANILTAPANDYVASFIGHGAALKRLALIPVNHAKLGPASAAVGRVTVPEGDTLRDALDALILTGAPAIGVTDVSSRVVASITVDQISAVLGAEAIPAVGGR